MIPNRFEFIPTPDTRKAWLSTRKQPYKCGEIELPGFYQTTDFEVDRRWFLFALAIEIAAIFLTLIGGFSKGNVFFIVAIIVVILFVIFDIVGSKWYHKYVGEDCLNRNRARLCWDNIAAKQGFLNKNKTFKLLKVAGVFLIILSAVFKIVAIFLLGRYPVIFYAIFTILYILVIYIHIKHTGYYLANTSSSFWKGFFFKIKKEHLKWLDDVINPNLADVPNSAKVKEGLIYESRVKISMGDNNEIKIGEHIFNKLPNNNDNDVYSYRIDTKGLLLDEDIVAFSLNQKPAAANEIAKICLQHQVNVVHSF